MKGLDIIVYYPLCCYGKYEPFEYSLKGSLMAYGFTKYFIKFIYKCRLTKESSQKICDSLNDKQ